MLVMETPIQKATDHPVWEIWFPTWPKMFMQNISVSRWDVVGSECFSEPIQGSHSVIRNERVGQELISSKWFSWGLSSFPPIWHVQCNLCKEQLWWIFFEMQGKKCCQSKKDNKKSNQNSVVNCVNLWHFLYTNRKDWNRNFSAGPDLLMV